jgi:hypothetical protein
VRFLVEDDDGRGSVNEESALARPFAAFRRPLAAFVGLRLGRVSRMEMIGSSDAG